MSSDIPNEYVLLVLTFDAVLSHLYLTNGYTEKKVHKKNSFADLLYMYLFFVCGVSGNKQLFYIA